MSRTTHRRTQEPHPFTDMGGRPLEPHEQTCVTACGILVVPDRAPPGQPGTCKRCLAMQELWRWRWAERATAADQLAAQATTTLMERHHRDGAERCRRNAAADLVPEARK